MIIFFYVQLASVLCVFCPSVLRCFWVGRWWHDTMGIFRNSDGIMIVSCHDFLHTSFICMQPRHDTMKYWKQFCIDLANIFLWFSMNSGFPVHKSKLKHAFGAFRAKKQQNLTCLETAIYFIQHAIQVLKKEIVASVSPSWLLACD